MNSIGSHHRVTLEEIGRKWLETEMSRSAGLARGTFSRHKDTGKTTIPKKSFKR